MKKKIKNLAIRFYESPQTDVAFSRAGSLFPDWNDGGGDTDSAAEHILSDIQARYPEGLSQTDRDALTAELESMIYAGLT